jgi:hypothetical protein
MATGTTGEMSARCRLQNMHDSLDCPWTLLPVSTSRLLNENGFR